MNLAVITLSTTQLLFKTIKNQGVSFLDFGLARTIFNIFVAYMIHLKLGISAIQDFPSDSKWYLLARGVKG